MVLLGRAKWLASQHPEWKILLVVYNNMLSKYLRSIPDMPRSVVIVTLKRFLEVRKAGNLSKLLLDFENPAEAEKTAAETVRRMKIDVDDKDIDALLVDEWQDFRAPYIQYLLSLLRPGRGGAMFAGDDKQAIYTDGYASPFGRRHVEREILTHPYRSTRQILRVAAALDKEYKIQGIDEAPSGEPVTAIYAPHWTLQGEAIALEIRQLLKRGQIVSGDIAVLCTTKQGSNHVANALQEKSIPYRHLTKFWEDQEPGGNEVNVMTVHGAKGHGFPVVFIQGFETLKDRDGTQERDKWRRVGFVGVSRAEDLLYILYKDVTQFVSTVLDLGKKHRGLVVGRMYPDDFKNLW
jgi:superfamily I DNA/RNA helicase